MDPTGTSEGLDTSEVRVAANEPPHGRRAAGMLVRGQPGAARRALVLVTSDRERGWSASMRSTSEARRPDRVAGGVPVGFLLHKRYIFERKVAHRDGDGSAPLSASSSDLTTSFERVKGSSL